MKRYVVRRICTGILTVLIAFALNFALMKMAPGDPITTLMGKDNDSPEMRQAGRKIWVERTDSGAVYELPENRFAGRSW